jgi:LDH2 family malate/lactate/ureidoglycolate dehydrogenase
LKVLDGGTVNPFGGYKGSGLALWMEIMGGVFTGAAFAGEISSLYGDFSGPQRIGHVFMAIRPDLFMPIEEFKNRMDTMMERYTSSPKAEGFDEILMPGEIEDREEAKRRTTGLPVSPEIAEELRREAAELGVPFPGAI